VVRTTEGTLLAFAEGRVLNCGDAADIDIVVKRSTDGGRTWGPLQVVNDGGGDTHGNPAPIVDRETGRILLAETYNTGRRDSASCTVPCDRTPHLQYSDDDGLTWSRPRDLSGEILSYEERIIMVRRRSGSPGQDSSRRLPRRSERRPGIRRHRRRRTPPVPPRTPARYTGLHRVALVPLHRHGW